MTGVPGQQPKYDGTEVPECNAYPRFGKTYDLVGDARPEAVITDQKDKLVECAHVAGEESKTLLKRSG